MAKRPTKTSRMVPALLVGLAATVLIAACHLFGLDGRTELLALDVRFRYFSSAPRNDDIVIVEIDDRSLKELGRWPWPREILAGIVETLQECGARAIALDIIMPEPQKPRYVSAESDIYDPDTAPLIGTPNPHPVFDDACFEDALGKGRVLLPMHLDFGSTDLGSDEALDAGIRKVLRADPNADFRSVLRDVLPDLPPATRTPEMERAARLYWRNRALHSLRRFVIPPGRARGYPARSGVAAPPLVRFAALCRGSGFVAFVPEQDGTVRRMPLLARSGEDIYPQFALVLASERLTGGKRPEIRADASEVRIGLPGGAEHAIPVDDRGRMLINWAPGRGSFPSESAARMASVWQLRKRIRRNRRYSLLTDLALAQQLKQTDLLKLFAKVDALYGQRTREQTARQRAALYDPGKAAPPSGATLAAEEAIERQIEDAVKGLLEDLDFLVGAKPREDPQRRAIEQLAAKHAELAAANAQHRRDIAEKYDSIRHRVKGKICIIGSTSTGAADFVPTPVRPRMPGVKVHANIFNTIASGAFVTEAHPAVNLAAILLAGALVSLLGARLPVLRAGVLGIVLAGAYTGANLWVVFAVLRCWLVLVAPIAAMAASFLVVTAYRQITEERAKRHIRNLFAHALSPALVDRLIEDPSLARVGGERRVLSCFFSDLAHFTPLAERLGEQGTVGLLNRYFDRMTEVIQTQCGGYLNKFLGDGIIGFFGAPVVQADHARRALAAAVACQAELVPLNESLREEFGDWVELSCRIGIATGPVMVGNCGSTQRMDYTAIGNCVNLASRLESANKQFATRVLVDDEAWRQGDDGSLLARPLGKILVVGKTEPVAVWHVLGLLTTASEASRLGAADFSRGVALFERRGFAEALRAFQAVLEKLPGDGPSRFHAALCRQYLANPPGEDWNGAIQLTEK